MLHSLPGSRCHGQGYDSPQLVDRLAVHMARGRPNVEEGKRLADRLLDLLAGGLHGRARSSDIADV